MIILEGKFGKCKVFSDKLDQESQKQLIDLLNHPIAKDAHVRIMPDVHAEASCVIGYTSKLTEIVVPNLIGVDIGCGVTSLQFNKLDIPFDELDDFIRKEIPLNTNIRDYPIKINNELEKNIIQVCKETNQNSDYVLRSIGTLGGGNHFIEVEKGNYYYLTVHSGSRNFGFKIAKHHQKVAKRMCRLNKMKKRIEEIKKKYKGKEIERQIKKLKSELKIKSGLEYLTEVYLDKYIEHMKVAQKFAEANRNAMLNLIIKQFDLKPIKTISSIHNYIDFEDNIIRKGAIRAYKGKLVVIPLNMKAGIIIGIGKGNPDWNYSAPHGAGREMSRRKAKKSISMKSFEEEMEGIWSSSIKPSVIDESPQAYKPPEKILKYLDKTVEILDIAKSIYVLKGD